jgi:thymidine kinase
MAKLYFRYGAMNSSKTANALMVAHNYKERGQRAVIVKPSVDTRDNIGVVKSRTGMQADVVTVSPDDTFAQKIDLVNDRPDCIIVDESQFLTAKQVSELSDIVDYECIPVICYGLRTDFQGKLFEGAEELLAAADTIEEIKTICWCGRKATYNARVMAGRMVKDGAQVAIGGNDMYVALCRPHWKMGKLKEADNGK